MQNGEWRMFMEMEQLTPLQIVETYKPEVEQLIKYQSYFEKMKGKISSSTFDKEGLAEHSLAFPVYDGVLLQFVKTAESTKLMNPNYHYIYTRNHIKNEKDELDCIRNCSIQKIDVILGILSKYIFKGKVKASVWSEGVKNGVFLEIIVKLQEIISFWDNNSEI